MAYHDLSGHQIEEIKLDAVNHFWPHGRQAGDLSDDSGIQIVSSADGVWIEDVYGEKWFDLISGMYLKNIGHGRKEIAEAVYTQMQSISYSPGGTITPVTAELAAKLSKLSPDKQSRVYFVSGGSEAVETAVKMAKQYHYNNGDRGRWKILSRRGSYHGATHMCMGLGQPGSSVSPFGPLIPGNIHVAQHDNYRGICNDGNGSCNLECARDIDRTIRHEGASTIAAFIGEPVSAASGTHIPHPDYWPFVQELCNRYNILLICDETINGFGRTGKMFATENWDIKPDIFTVAKGLTSGYIPIGAAIANKKIADSFIGSDERTFKHLITFGGNPIASAAALENIRILESEGMVDNSAEKGTYLFESLKRLHDHNIVGDVRGGLGLMASIELVQDREGKKPFPKEADLYKKVGQAFKKNHILGSLARGGDIAIYPPLCVTNGELDELIYRLDQTLSDIESNI